MAVFIRICVVLTLEVLMSISDHDISDCQNTWAMSQDPQLQPDYCDMDGVPSVQQALRVLTVFSGQMFSELVAYQVIVENWDKRKFGRHQRRWLKTFSKAERRKIGKHYAKFYKWYLISGVSRTVMARTSTIVLLTRAAAFFAEC